MKSSIKFIEKNNNNRFNYKIKRDNNDKIININNTNKIIVAHCQQRIDETKL